MVQRVVIPQIEFEADPGAVEIHGPQTDTELGGDLMSAHGMADELEDLHFAVRQTAQWKLRLGLGSGGRDWRYCKGCWREL